MQKETIFLDNIKCGGCANNISISIDKIGGISDIEVFPDDDKIILSYENEVAKQAALSKLADMGYPLKGTSNLTQKGKSYVSCAIGKVK